MNLTMCDGLQRLGWVGEKKHRKFRLYAVYNVYRTVFNKTTVYSVTGYVSRLKTHGIDLLESRVGRFQSLKPISRLLRYTQGFAVVAILSPIPSKGPLNHKGTHAM